MVYHCLNCHYLFDMDGLCERCPDCGSTRVFVGNEKDQAEYEAYRKEFSQGRIESIKNKGED